MFALTTLLRKPQPLSRVARGITSNFTHRNNFPGFPLSLPPRHLSFLATTITSQIAQYSLTPPVRMSQTDATTQTEAPTPCSTKINGAAKPNKLFRVKKLSEFAIVPTRGSSGAAGYDLSAAYEGVVPARGKALIKTDLAMVIDPTVYGRVAPRSGLAWKNSIDVGAGVIDSDYRGNIGVILFNHSDVDFVVNRGDRIAQLIFEKIDIVDFQEVDDLEQSTRGDGGFGSTGIAQKQ